MSKNRTEQLAAIADNSPVLVGSAALNWQSQEWAGTLEPLELMIAACKQAEQQSGVRILERAGSISVPQGFWGYSNPARLVANALGAERAETVLAEIGVMQQTLFSRACQSIAAGELEVAVIVGGEARYRAKMAQQKGVELIETVQQDDEPDIRLKPDRDFGPALEGERGLMLPVSSYAIMENALRHHRGLSLTSHLQELNNLVLSMNRVAVDNPWAWNRDALTLEQLQPGVGSNHLLAWPYGRFHASQWTVDQSSAFILCSAGLARELGIDEAHWVFPWSAAENNTMFALSQRPELYGSPGFALVGRKVLEMTDLELEQIDLLDLYSCFPSAVQIQALELGLELPLQRPVTITGGMSFAGGPLNNYMLQASARMAGLLQQNQEKIAMISCVSGLLHKQGMAIWSAMPPPKPFAFAELSSSYVAAVGKLRDLNAEAIGPAVIAGYTVNASRSGPDVAVTICDLPDGQRTIAQNDDPEITAQMMQQECCERQIALTAPGRFVFEV